MYKVTPAKSKCSFHYTCVYAVAYYLSTFIKLYQYNFGKTNILVVILELSICHFIHNRPVANHITFRVKIVTTKIMSVMLSVGERDVLASLQNRTWLIQYGSRRHYPLVTTTPSPQKGT